MTPGGEESLPIWPVWPSVRAFLLAQGTYYGLAVLNAALVVALASTAGVHGTVWEVILFETSATAASLLVLLIAAREFGAIAYLRQRLSLVRPLDARRFVAVVGWATLIAGAIALGDEVVEIVELAVGGSGAGVHPLPEHMGLPLLVGKLHGVFVGPLVEELVYRFVLLNGLRSALSFPWAAAITSVLFALAHAPNGWPDFAAFWWSGMIFAWGYRASGSIMSAIAGHALCNARAFFF